uniref:Apolipoprotein L n=1 Tax=Sparus aurata TaxID=8175 RepID=A0A671Z0I8_SPAAU
MSGKRQQLQQALCRYTTDTLTYFDTVRGFCQRISSWMDAREAELVHMRDIKDRADKINLSFRHVTQSQSKGKALGEYIKNKVTSADNRCAKLQKELADVLKFTLGGLKKLDHFLEAVEKLAVTSLHVFMEENQVLHLPEGISLEHVQDVIIAAQQICPLLLEFKRDASVFFLPKLQNVEVLSNQLDKYIKTTGIICEKLEKSQRLLIMTTTTLADLGVNLSEEDAQRILCHINQQVELGLLFQRATTEPAVDLDVDLSEDKIQRMLGHINQLDEIRMDQNFRLVFLFQDVSCSGFISEFNERQPRMLQFLTDLEEGAVQLDRMNKGAKISSVAGSSVGAVGGVLSIVGLALIPVTAGVSLGLTIGGVALGVTSGVNSAVTTATEMGVNRTQQKKASEVFQSFMEDVQSLQGCLEEVMGQIGSNLEASDVELVVGVGKVLSKVGAVGKGIDALVDAASALKLLKNEKAIVNVGRVVAQEGKALRNVPRVAADIPDIGQAAVKGPLALTKGARAGFIALNALFLGMDVFYICKDGYSLSKGSETEFSQFIRARAALWSSEMDSWKKIHDSLCKGQKTSEEHRAVLDRTFYPRR